MADNTNSDFWVQTEEEASGDMPEDIVTSKSDTEGIAFTDEVIIEKIT